MAKRGRPKKYGDPTPNVDSDRMLQLAASIQQIDGEIASLRADRSAYLQEIRTAAIQERAFKECMRIAEMPPGERELYLACFDQYRLAFELDQAATKLDQQTDLIDRLKAVA